MPLCPNRQRQKEGTMSKILALVLLLGFSLSVEIELQSQSSVPRLSSNSQVQPELKGVNPTPGYSYLTRIPFVTAETSFRTNVGLNNFSQLSFVKGANPPANVRLTLVDQQGHVAGQGTYVVRSNELLQINDIISALSGNVAMGWLEVLSDEPLTAWASVIFNTTNDPCLPEKPHERLILWQPFSTTAGQRACAKLLFCSSRCLPGEPTFSRPNLFGFCFL
jgi:hypothetical protein